MTTSQNTTSKNQTDVTHEISTFALGVGIASTAVVGIWACACMISALANHGVINVAKGLIGAIF